MCPETPGALHYSNPITPLRHGPKRKITIYRMFGMVRSVGIPSLLLTTPHPPQHGERSHSQSHRINTLEERTQ